MWDGSSSLLHEQFTSAARLMPECCFVFRRQLALQEARQIHFMDISWRTHASGNLQRRNFYT